MEDLERRLVVMEFEFKHLTDRIVNDKLERWIPGIASERTHRAHIKRYEWVAQFVTQKRVLDLACGAGFGSRCLLDKGNALSVLGGDVNRDSIEYCKAKHGESDRLKFKIIDAEMMECSESVDVVVSFETVEHLNHPQKFLRQLSTCLETDGNLFISTPISKLSFDDKPENPYHVMEWGAAEFLHLLGQNNFKVAAIFIQPFSIRKRVKLHERAISKLRNLFWVSRVAKDNGYDSDELDIINVSDESALASWQEKISSGHMGAYLLVHAQKELPD